MWDLNRAERRAMAGAVFLVGLGALGRGVWAPGPADTAWEPVEAVSAGLDDTESAVRSALAREQRAQTPLASGERIDPNAAAGEELRRLPGVGPALATAILRERERAPFAEASDLQRVPGIGEATARRLAPHLEFDGGPPPASGPASIATGGGPPPPIGDECATGGALDLNRASAARLEALPGIGPVLAARIVEHRTRHGPFAAPAELIDVPGIGPRSLSRLESRICAGRP